LALVSRKRQPLDSLLRILAGTLAVEIHAAKAMPDEHRAAPIRASKSQEEGQHAMTWGQEHRFGLPGTAATLPL